MIDRDFGDGRSMLIQCAVRNCRWRLIQRALGGDGSDLVSVPPREQRRVALHHRTGGNRGAVLHVTGREVEPRRETGVAAEIPPRQFADGLLQFVIGVHLSVGLVGRGVETPVVEIVSSLELDSCLVRSPPVGDGIEGPVGGLEASKLGCVDLDIFCRVGATIEQI